MKSRLAVISVAALVLTALVATASGSVVAGARSEVDQARQAGQSFIQTKTAVFPDWEGASLGGAQTYYDLQGAVDAYLFPIQRAGSAIGRIVVGSAAYEYDVLEAGAAPPPEIPSSAELATAVNKDLGIEAATEGAKPVRLVYLGYDSFAAIYDLAASSVAFDLRHRRAALASELKSQMTPVQQYVTPTTGGQSPLTFEYKNLPVPTRDMADPLIPDWMRNNNNCGPTSGAMIAEYYRSSRGWTILPNWPDDHNFLYQSMYTNQFLWFNGTMPQYAGPGFTAYMATRGYYFVTSWNTASAWENAYIKTRIDSQQPVLILFWGSPPYAQWHYCAISGYWIDDAGWYLIVNNPWGYSDLVNWNANWFGVSLHYLYPP